MKHSSKKTVSLLLALVLAASLLLSGCSSTVKNASASDTAASPSISAQASESPDTTAGQSSSPDAAKASDNTVTDLMGRTVTVKSADKILTMCGTGLEKVLLLGHAQNIVGSMGTGSAWAQYIAPSTGTIAALGNPAKADVEAMLATGADLAFYWDEQEKIDDLTQNGVAVICTQVSANTISTVDEFVDYMCSEIYLYADALGADAQAKADKWVEYVHNKIDYVTDRVSTLDKSDYVTVYNARSEATNCFAGGSYPNFLIQMAGGTSLTADLEGLTADVTEEQIAAWNPDFIFTGRMADTSAFDDPVYANLNAVKNGNVYITPNGVMQWDTGSECILYLEYMAQILHPDLFKDLDMTSEVKEYYSTFFGTDLTDEQAGYILQHLNPDGTSAQ